MKPMTLSPQKAITEINKRISAKDKFAFACGFLMCLIVNLFVYTNTCFVHDSIMLYNDSKGITNGRLLVGPLMALTNRLQLPWLIGLISCVLMGFIIVFFSKIYHIRNKLYLVFLAGFIVTCDTIVVTHTYLGSLYIYFFSLLMAVMAVYYADKVKYGYLLSVGLLCVSMLAYQAFLATAIGLFIFKLMVLALDGDMPIKKQLQALLKYASLVIIAVGIYYAIWKAALLLANTQLANYGAYSNIQQVPAVSSLLTQIETTFYISLIQLFGVAPHGFYILNIVYDILCVLGAILLCYIKKPVLSHLLMIVYVVAFIFSINTMYLLSGSTTYALTVFSLALPLCLLLYLLENHFQPDKKALHNAVTWFACALSIVLIIGQSIYANSLYLKTKVNYDNAWSYATRVVDRMEQTEGFTKDTKVVIISKSHSVTAYPSNAVINYKVSYPLKSSIANAYVTSNNAITYAETLQWFIEQEMDMDMNITTNPEEYRKDKDIENMGIFPASDSIQWRDGKLVVKIS